LASGYTWEVLGSAWTYTLGAGFALAGLAWLARGWPVSESKNEN
ncbi:MAG: MFS transporter, partial [Proteobacteria bacterium]|nr:MFS transporter [Pseudomonadota bacterium]